MALSIKSDEADRLARELAEATGESMTQAILVALRERLQREVRHDRLSVGARLRRLASDAAELPVLDERPPDELVGYDHRGLPR